MLFRRLTALPNGPKLPAVALRAAAILRSSSVVYAAAHDSHRTAMTTTKSREKNPTQHSTLARQSPNSSARTAWTSAYKLLHLTDFLILCRGIAYVMLPEGRAASLHCLSVSTAMCRAYQPAMNSRSRWQTLEACKECASVYALA